MQSVALSIHTGIGMQPMNPFFKSRLWACIWTPSLRDIFSVVTWTCLNYLFPGYRGNRNTLTLSIIFIFIQSVQVRSGLSRVSQPILPSNYVSGFPESDSVSPPEPPHRWGRGRGPGWACQHAHHHRARRDVREDRHDGQPPVLRPLQRGGVQQGPLQQPGVQVGQASDVSHRRCDNWHQHCDCDTADTWQHLAET